MGSAGGEPESPLSEKMRFRGLPRSARCESKVSQKFAFLSLLDSLTIIKISNLRAFNTQPEYDPH